MSFISVIIYLAFFVKTSFQNCLHVKRIQDERSFRLNPQLECDTRIKLSQGLSVQVTCTKVSNQLYDENCRDLMLIINSKNADENLNSTDRFCVLQHFNGHGILSQVDRLYINPNYIDLKIEKFQRTSYDNLLTSCSITTKKLPQTPPSNSRSFLTKNNILPLSGLQNAMLKVNFSTFEAVDSDCGNIKIEPNFNGRILGGQEATPHNYNWMVVLVLSFANGRRSLCGGSIISKTKVISAAHCVSKVHSIRIFYGFHEISRARKNVKVENYVIHEDYKFPAHDIAIITVAKPFEFSSTIGQICLPTLLNEGLYNNEKVIAMGWGKTRKSSYSNVLKENSLRIISDRICRSFYGRNLNKDIFCTMDIPGESICQGDSGSAVGKIENGRFILYGIVSFTSSRGCKLGYPTGFTEIQPHLDWIMKNI